MILPLVSALAWGWLVKPHGKVVWLNRAALERYFSSSRAKAVESNLRLVPSGDGLIVKAVPDDPAVRALGIRAGDQLETLNGFPLDLTALFDPVKLRALSDSWRQGRPFNLILKRHGVVRHLVFLPK